MATPPRARDAVNERASPFEPSRQREPHPGNYDERHDIFDEPLHTLASLRSCCEPPQNNRPVRSLFDP